MSIDTSGTTPSITNTASDIDETTSWTSCWALPSDFSPNAADEMNFSTTSSVTTLTYDGSGGTTSATGVYGAADDAVSNGDWSVVSHRTGGFTITDGTDTFSYLTSDDVVSADIGFSSTSMVAAAIVGDELAIGYGTPSSLAWETWDVHVDGTTVTPLEVAVYANADQVVVAVTAHGTDGTDYVGYTFMSW